MATIGMGDLKKGIRLEIDGQPYRVVEYQHVKPGKGAAFVRIKIKSLSTGRVIEKTVHAGDKFETPNLEQKTMQYLYDDGEMLQFMDEGFTVDVLFHNGKPISVELPQTVELEVVETPPNFKGDTSSGSRKPATLKTGAVVQVPYHILEGDVIRVDTTEGKYLDKVK